MLQSFNLWYICWAPTDSYFFAICGYIYFSDEAG